MRGDVLFIPAGTTHTVKNTSRGKLEIAYFLVPGAEETVEAPGSISEKRGRSTDIDEYIAAFPKDVQVILQKMRETIHEAAPGAVECISYSIPTFKLYGYLVHFAAFRHHIGFYPTSSGIAAFKKELAQHRTSPGTVQFSFDKPVPFDLVRRITLFRVQEDARKPPRRRHVD